MDGAEIARLLRVGVHLAEQVVELDHEVGALAQQGFEELGRNALFQRRHVIADRHARVGAGSLRPRSDVFEYGLRVGGHHSISSDLVSSGASAGGEYSSTSANSGV